MVAKGSFKPICITLSPIIIFSMFVAGDVYFIIPSTPSGTVCPVEALTPCHTLSEFAANCSSLSPNTTLILLPGNHSLDNQLIVRGINYFTIIAINTTMVVCNYGSSIVITETQYVSITGMIFTGCNGSVLSVINEFVLENSTFSDSTGIGAALLIIDTIAAIKKSSFLNNYYNQDSRGGALYVESSTVVFTESTISNNRGYYHGGGIYSVNSTITIADGSTVSYNSVNHGNGGGIYAVDSTVIFNVSNISSNSARSYGSALYGVNVEIYILSSSVNNHMFSTSVVHILASSDSSKASTITIHDSVFEYNGAQTLSGTDVSLLIERSNFFNNKNERYEIGGIIFISTQFHTSALTIMQTIFERNGLDYYGGEGVIHSMHTNITIVSSKFFYQYSGYGYGDAAVLKAGGSTVTILRSTFSNNLSGKNGGALKFESTIANIEGSTFHRNTAFGGSAGVIYADDYSDLTITKCRFTQNLVVESGGALVLLNSQAVISDSVFSSNTAFEDGGAIYIDGYSTSSNSNLTVDNCTFSYNTATRHGGVIYASLATVIFNETVIGCNMAHLNGDLVYAIESSKVIITSSKYSDNRIATDSLIYTDTSSNATTKNVSFVTSSCDLISEGIFTSRCQNMVLQESNTYHLPTEAPVDFDDTSETLAQTEMPNESEPSSVPHNILASHIVIHHIKPNDTTCPEEPCSTLSEFAATTSSLNSNTTLLLQPGHHILDHQLFAMSVDYFSIISTNATIYCNPMASISVNAVEYFFMSGVTLSGCNGNTVFLVSEFVLEDSSFSDSSGTALHIINTTATIKRSSFIKNHDQDSRGGALYVENSTVVLSESTITNNGRGMYCTNSIITMNTSIISNNTVSSYNDGYGGGVYANHSTVVFYRSHISNNSARRFGAALYGIDVVVSFTACNVSNHRTAPVVYASTSFNCSTITIIDSIFSYNSDGSYGAVLSGNDIVLTIEKSTFHNNKDGIVHTVSGSHTCSMSLSIYKSTFERNVARFNAAAIYSTSTNATIVESKFNHHYVKQGYYDYDAQGSVLHLTGSAITITHCVFSNNIALHGGSAIYINTNRANIQKSIFHHNYAISGSGGAIYMHTPYYGQSVDLLITQCTFTENLAEFGGAVYMTVGNNIYDAITIRDSQFSNNMALENGGAIYVHGNGYNLMCNIDNNTLGYNGAGKEGGVVYVNMATVAFNKTTFICNTANVRGNLAYATESSSIEIANSIWTDDVGIAHIYADITSNITTRDLLGVSVSTCDPCQSRFDATTNPAVPTIEKVTSIHNDYSTTTQITSGTTDQAVLIQTTMAFNVTHSDTSAISTTNIVVILVVIPCFLALLIASVVFCLYWARVKQYSQSCLHSKVRSMNAATNLTFLEQSSIHQSSVIQNDYVLDERTTSIPQQDVMSDQVENDNQGKDTVTKEDIVN